MILVRPAVPEDAAAMSAVLTASIRDLCTADPRNDPAILSGWLRNKQGQYMVLSQDGRVLKRGHELINVLRVLELAVVK